MDVDLYTEDYEGEETTYGLDLDKLLTEDEQKVNQNALSHSFRYVYLVDERRSQKLARPRSLSLVLHLRGKRLCNQILELPAAYCE